MRRLLPLLLVACSSSAREQPRAAEPAPRQVLTPDLALARIESTYRAGVQRCYQSWLKRDPHARGDVVVTFTVDEAGKLSSPSAKGVHRTIETCVERAMLRWAFPAPSRAMTIRVALRLSSRS